MQIFSMQNARPRLALLGFIKCPMNTKYSNDYFYWFKQGLPGQRGRPGEPGEPGNTVSYVPYDNVYLRSF